MQKFSFVFGKHFRKIKDFFAKINEVKNAKKVNIFIYVFARQIEAKIFAFFSNKYKKIWRNFFFANRFSCFEENPS